LGGDLQEQWGEVGRPAAGGTWGRTGEKTAGGNLGGEW